MEKLLESGQSIISSRTGKTLKCYNISAVYRGFTSEVKSYEYGFIVRDGHFKSIKQDKLKEMLTGVWTINLNNL